jgi:HK97 family phage major capsid protein
MKANELFKLARDKYQAAQKILQDDAGDYSQADSLMDEAKSLEDRATQLKKAEGFEMPEETATPAPEMEKKGMADFRAQLEENFNPAIVDTFMKMLDKESVDLGSFQSGNAQGTSFGDFLKSVRFKDSSRLAQIYNAKKDDIKDLSGGTGASGGYLIPHQFIAELLRVDEGEAVVRPYARKIPMASRSLSIPKLEQGDKPAAYWKLDYYGGVLSYWTAEGGAKSETEPEFGALELNAHKLAGFTQASDELLADSGIGIESLLTELFRGAIVMREDFAFLRGTGVGMPLGIFNSPVLLTQARNTVNQINHQDISNMLGQFMPSSFGKAVWVCSITALPQLLQMEDGAGNNMFIPNSTGGITQSIPGTLLGRPVIITEKVPALGSTGDLLLADFSYYIIGDRQATTIASSEHYAFTNDLTTWRFVHRVDGQPWLDAPIYIDTTNQVSPFVALAA